MVVRGLVVEKIGLLEQDDEFIENIDRNNLGKDVCFSFICMIYLVMQEMYNLFEVIVDLMDCVMLGE